MASGARMSSGRVGGGGRTPASSTDRPAEVLHPDPGQPPLRPEIPPGERIAGSTIEIPQTIRAGAGLRGKVPGGSRVEVNGQPVAVAPDGRFEHVVGTAGGAVLIVRVIHPDGLPATFRVRVTD